MIIHANILDWAASYDGEPFHAALMDAPYEMQFMGKDWDNTGVAFNPETWRLIARCLYPGAFLFVMAGTINDDLISVAMRQAGLRKYHRAAAWTYGSGFPKATRIDVQVDRRAGAERRTVGTRKHQPKFDAKGFEYRKKDNGFNSKDRATFDVTAPATDLAQAWAGHRYGGQMLKPALESILIFQKPYAGRPVESITATGAGALNIEGGRIGTEQHSYTPRLNHSHNLNDGNWYGVGGDLQDTSAAGRWPPNFCLVHHPACERVGTRRVKGSKGEADYRPGAAASIPAGCAGGTIKTGRHHADPDGLETVADWRCHPNCVVRRLGEQSGESESKRSQRGTVEIFDELYKRAPSWHGESTERGHDDTGTAARFFHQSDWMAERLEAADQVGYFAKASRGERENGLEPEQIQLLRELYGSDDTKDFDEETINDGRKKSIDNPYQRGETTRRNIHPTVKPISLCKWLATLLLPPAIYAPRRLLVPFAGVASEYLGAMFAGWEEIVGVELEEKHCRIAESRINWWQTMLRQTHSSDPGAILRTYGTTSKAKPSSPARWPAGSLFENLEEE